MNRQRCTDVQYLVPWTEKLRFSVNVYSPVAVLSGEEYAFKDSNTL